jgi:hypothetical protein
MSQGVELKHYSGPQITTKEEYDQLPDELKMTYNERVRAVRQLNKEFPDFADPRVTRGIEDDNK